MNFNRLPPRSAEARATAPALMSGPKAWEIDGGEAAMELVARPLPEGFQGNVDTADIALRVRPAEAGVEDGVFQFRHPLGLASLVDLAREPRKRQLRGRPTIGFTAFRPPASACPSRG